MKISKKIALPVVTVAILGVGGATAMAATSSNSQQSLAQEIANKFHLDKSQVQSVIDNHRTEMQQNREANYESRLSDAVKDGQLTDAQKQSILTEHNKLINELKSASQADRRTTMQNVRQEAKDWAKQNNIDAKWLMPMRHRM
jgi:GTP1/Obg family GTP-binding protein